MKSRKSWVPLLILFILLNAIFLLGKNILEKKGFDSGVLIGGNAILFIATALSFYISLRSLSNANAGASVRSLYGSFMIKFFLIITAAFIYIMVAKKDLNKPALFTCMGLYLVYMFVEIISLQNLLRRKKI